MNQKLVIQNDLVQIIEETVTRQIPLQKLFPHLVQKVPVTIPVLPRTSRFVHLDESQPNKKVINFLCEVPAGVKTITKENKDKYNKRRYRLSFPWTYFFITAVAEGAAERFVVTNWKCFHSRKEFDGLPGEFYVAFLPNIYKETGEICFGSAGGPPGSLADQIDFIVNNFYITEFNDHLDRSHMVWPFNGTSFKNWVDATEAKGASAWRDFPEWTSGTRQKFTLHDLLGGANVARSERIEGGTAIPEIPSPMTFGRAEEWIRNIAPQDRGRLKIALGNVVEDDPNAVEAPVEIAEVTDDGGVPF